MMLKKNILFIKNNTCGNKLDYLEKYFNINLTWLDSVDLINKDLSYLKKIVDQYDIFIIGGGPQHILGNYNESHPEINHQLKLVQMISNTNKLLIGICLGCQIIAKAFCFEIIPMDKLCIGFNYLDTNSIDFDFINLKNDKYLCKLDFDLLSNSFSYHYDCVSICDCFENNKTNINNCADNYTNTKNKLKCIGYSKLNVPYIFTHLEANIYGFQFHPEITSDCICNIADKHHDINFDYPIKKLDHDIYLHFFNIFINTQ